MTCDRTPICDLRLLAALLLVASPAARPAGEDDFLTPSPIVQAVGAFEQGEVERAEQLVLPLAAGEPATAEACSLLGQIRLRQGRAAEAAEQFGRAVAKNPASAVLRARLGAALLAQGGAAAGEGRAVLLARARTELDRAAGLDTGCSEAQTGLLHFHLLAPQAGATDAAERHAAAVVALDPISGAMTVADLAENFGRLDLAERYYGAIVEIDPWFRYKHGTVLAKLGRTADARSEFEKVLRIAPGHGPAQQALAALPAQP